MNNLRKTVAALGFVCFFSLALLPVSMTVCGLSTLRIFHPAKRLHRVSRDSFSQLKVAPHRIAFERDAIPQGDFVRHLFQHAGCPAGAEPDVPEVRLSQGFVRDAKISDFAFHTVLIL